MPFWPSTTVHWFAASCLESARPRPDAFHCLASAPSFTAGCCQRSGNQRCWAEEQQGPVPQT